MISLARVSLLLVVMLVGLSAYLRLHHSGIGCPDFPACYGSIGAPAQRASGAVESAYQRIVAESSAPLAWAQPLHRLVASLLGLCILFLTLLSLRTHRHRLLGLALLALTVFLAWIGLRSGSMHSTAIVMGNLAGGFIMAGLLGWVVFSSPRHSGHHRHPGLDPETSSDSIPGSRVASFFSWTAIALLAVQIILGGFTSANFAALACTTLPDCQGSYWPGPELAQALELDRTIEVSEDGIAIGGPERQSIHKAHRIGAVLALAAILAATFAALRVAALRLTAMVVLALVSTEFVVGVAAVRSSLPIWLAVSHNWLAALLLLGLLRLAALSRA